MLSLFDASFIYISYKGKAEIPGVKGFLMKPVVKYDMVQMVRNAIDNAKISLRKVKSETFVYHISRRIINRDYDNKPNNTWKYD